MTQTVDTAIDMLTRVDLFSGLSRRRLKRLIDQTRIVDHEAGHVIAAEGAGGLAFHMIVSGRAVVSVGPDQVRELGPGEYFGEIGMIDGKPRSATVTVTEPARILAIPHLLFEQLTTEEPEFARGLLLVLCARLREADARLAQHGPG